MPSDRPVALHHLSFAGQLVVWTARHWVSAHGCCPAIAREFSGPLGERAGMALADAFDALFGIMNAAARRPMVFGPLRCRHVWRDEGTIVRLVEMAQREYGAWVLDRLGDFLPPAAARGAFVHVDEIAGLLADAGYSVTLDAVDDAQDALPGLGEAEPARGKIILH